MHLMAQISDIPDWVRNGMIFQMAPDMIIFRVQEEAQGNIDSEMATVMSSIATACKQIANLVNR